MTRTPADRRGRLIPARVLPFLVTTALILGCGGSSTDSLPRESISGSVKLDGKPLGSGMISFDPENQQTGQVAVGAVISGGAYSIPKANGPTPGSYRVSILPVDDAPGASRDEAPGAPPKLSKAAVVIPEKYNVQSTLKTEIKAGGANRFDVDMTSK